LGEGGEGQGGSVLVLPCGGLALLPLSAELPRLGEVWVWPLVLRPEHFWKDTRVEFHANWRFEYLTNSERGTTIQRNFRESLKHDVEHRAGQDYCI